MGRGRLGRRARSTADSRAYAGRSSTGVIEAGAHQANSQSDPRVAVTFFVERSVYMKLVEHAEKRDESAEAVMERAARAIARRLSKVSTR